MNKHTQGEWRPDYSGPARIAIMDQHDRMIAFCNLQGEDGDEDEANARLIAAAPELLEALEAVVSAREVADVLRNAGMGSAEYLAWIKASEVIAKAKGQA